MAFARRRRWVAPDGGEIMEFVAAVIAIVAIILAITARKRITQLEQRASALETRLAHPFAAEAAPRTAPLPEPLLPAEAAVPAAATVPPARVDEAAADAVTQEAAASDAAPPEPPAPAAPAAPPKSFEERFGASWVVWIGGVALALG